MLVDTIWNLGNKAYFETQQGSILRGTITGITIFVGQKTEHSFRVYVNNQGSFEIKKNALFLSKQDLLNKQAEALEEQASKLRAGDK